MLPKRLSELLTYYLVLPAGMRSLAPASSSTAAAAAPTGPPLSKASSSCSLQLTADEMKAPDHPSKSEQQTSPAERWPGESATSHPAMGW